MTRTETTIERVDAWACSFPLARPLNFGTFRVDRRDFVVARVVTAGGLEGYAYALSRSAPTDLVLTELLGPLVVGKDALDIPRLREDCSRAMLSLGVVGIVRRALSLLDICLWDLKAKVADLPVWRLLGGDRTVAPILLVAPYAEPDESDREYGERLQALVEQGYRILKTYQAATPSLTTRRLDQLRAILGPDVGLVVDLSWVWSDVRAAIATARSWEEFNLDWIEDPFPSDELEQIRTLARSAAVPIACGDEVSVIPTLEDLIRNRAVDVVRLDATTIGGFSSFLPLHEMAMRHGLRVSPHAHPEIHMHCVFAFPGVGPVEIFPPGSPTWGTGRFITNEPRATDSSGVLRAPEQPGLGLGIDWDAVRANAIRATSSPA